MKQKILQRGAEALILLDGNNIIKRRVKKSYRLVDIDEEIRKLRTRSEAKLLSKASEIIDIPEIKKVDEAAKEICMEFIDGKKLSEHLDSFPLEEQKKICGIIGKAVAQLHDSDIIHGDLTTSNMIYVDEFDKEELDFNNKNKKVKLNNKSSIINNLLSIDSSDHNKISKNEKRGDKNFKIFFIDFGLGFHSHKIEDKAVDLHLLRQALEAKHFKNWNELFHEVLKSYSDSKNSKLVLEQLKKVERRGRYKDKY